MTRLRAAATGAVFAARWAVGGVCSLACACLVIHIATRREFATDRFDVLPTED